MCRCNKLNFCQVPVHSDDIHTVCPDTPKYLEAQYRCKPNNVMREKVLPRFQGNISDVWSNRNKVLNIENVEVAIDKMIANHEIPITEKSASMVNSSEISDRNVNLEYVNIIHSLRTTLFVHKKKRLNNSARLRNKSTTTVPLLLTKSSLSDSSPVDDDDWTFKEVLIIILSSSLSVILIIITAAMVIVKVQLILLS